MAADNKITVGWGSDPASPSVLQLKVIKEAGVEIS